MAHIAINSPAGAHMSPGSGSIRFFAIFGVAGQRRQLKSLDAHLLTDIGVSAPDAHAEARRPFWDAPSHWSA